jgi:Meiotically up-regulated gene 113
MAEPRCGKLITRGRNKGKPCGVAAGHSRKCTVVTPAMQQEWIKGKQEADPGYQERIRERGRERNKRKYQEGCHEDLAYLYYSPGLGTHKIGHTTNLRHNESALRRGCWDIKLTDTFPGGLALERWLHGRFEDRRISGSEWFRGLTASEVREAVAEWSAGGDVA